MPTRCRFMFGGWTLVLLCTWIHLLDCAVPTTSHSYRSYRTELYLNDISDDAVSLISNTEIDIELVHNRFIINHRKILSFANDSAFNEIQYITTPFSNVTDDSMTKSMFALLPDQFNTSNSHRRRLLWNKFDHSTERHLKMGRFIGDPSKKRTFDDARSLCREYYGDLVSVNSREENEQVKQLCTEIGGKGAKCWLGLTQPYYEWENAQYVSWSDWGPGEPTNSNSEKCTRLNADTSGDWSDCPCNEELYTICEKQAASYHGHYVVVSKQTSKKKAETVCRKQFGSTLATIITSQDAIMAHEACKKVARAPHGCWIGLNSPYTSWDNGLPVKAIKGKSWKNDVEPAKALDKCVEIDKDGMWRAIPCEYDRHVLCNVRGTVTRQAIQDEEYMRKLQMGAQEKKLEKASEGAAREAAEEAKKAQAAMKGEDTEKKEDGNGDKEEGNKKEEEDTKEKANEDGDGNDDEDDDEDENGDDDNEKKEDSKSGSKTSVKVEMNPVAEEIKRLQGILKNQEDQLRGKRTRRLKKKKKSDDDEDGSDDDGDDDDGDNGDSDKKKKEEQEAAKRRREARKRRRERRRKREKEERERRRKREKEKEAMDKRMNEMKSKLDEMTERLETMRRKSEQSKKAEEKMKIKMQNEKEEAEKRKEKIVREQRMRDKKLFEEYLKKKQGNTATPPKGATQTKSAPAPAPVSGESKVETPPSSKGPIDVPAAKSPIKTPIKSPIESPIKTPIQKPAAPKTPNVPIAKGMDKHNMELLEKLREREQANPQSGAKPPVLPPKPPSNTPNSMPQSINGIPLSPRYRMQMQRRQPQPVTDVRIWQKPDRSPSMRLSDEIKRLKAIDARHYGRKRWKDADPMDDISDLAARSSKSLIARLKERYKRVKEKTNDLERMLDKEAHPSPILLPPGHHGQKLIDLHEMTRPLPKKKRMEPQYQIQIAERTKNYRQPQRGPDYKFERFPMSPNPSIPQMPQNPLNAPKPKTLPTPPKLVKPVKPKMAKKPVKLSPKPASRPYSAPFGAKPIPGYPPPSTAPESSTPSTPSTGSTPSQSSSSSNGMDKHNMELLQKLREQTETATHIELEEYLKQKKSALQTQKGDPFGGALGGSLKTPVRNPYDSKPVLQTQSKSVVPPPKPVPSVPAPAAPIRPIQSIQPMPPPVPPMNPMQMLLDQMGGVNPMMVMNQMPRMNAMNPLNLPAIPGMRGRYSSRRLLTEYPYTAISKCIHEDAVHGFIVCFEYHLERQVLTIEAMTCADCHDDKSIDYGMDTNDDVQYYNVDRLHFEDKRQCQEYGSGEKRACIDMEMDNVMVYMFAMEDKVWVIEDTLRFEDDAQSDRTCIMHMAVMDTSLNAVCLVRQSRSQFTLEIRSQAKRSL